MGGIPDEIFQRTPLPIDHVEELHQIIGADDRAVSVKFRKNQNPRIETRLEHLEGGEFLPPLKFDFRSNQISFADPIDVHHFQVDHPVDPKDDSLPVRVFNTGGRGSDSRQQAFFEADAPAAETSRTSGGRSPAPVLQGAVILA